MRQPRKKLKETIASPKTNGIFHALLREEVFEWLDDTGARNLDVEYYLNHSGDKFVSNIYRNLLNEKDLVITSDNELVLVGDEPLITDDLNVVINNGVLQSLAKILINKFGDKWNRLYSLLIETKYNPIHNYDADETITKNLGSTKREEINSKISTSGGVHEYAYGFNSPNETPTNKQSSNSTVEGNAQDNFTYETGSDTGTIHTEKSGNIGVTTTQKMMLSEIELRDAHNFVNIVYKDVDSLLCLSIY